MLAEGVHSTRVTRDLRMMIDGVRQCGMHELARELTGSLTPA